MVLSITDSTSKDCSSTSNGAQTADQNLQQLMEMWQADHRRGLDVRHQTGVILNSQFGLPITRQAQGAEVFKRYSEHLKISESEPNRMRWFAHHFTSLADLKARHPEVLMWTQVRELLVSLRQRKSTVPKAKKAASRKGTTGRPKPVKKTLRAIQAASRLFSGLELKPGDANWKAVNEAVAVMLKAVEQSLGVHYLPEFIAAVEAKMCVSAAPMSFVDFVPTMPQLILA